MLRKSFFALVVCSALGCAGNNIFHGPTAFAGAYAGTWASTTTSESGTLAATINSSADMQGSFTDNTRGLSGTLTGNVDQNGNFFADATYPNGGGTAHLHGILTNSNVGLSGNGTISINGGQAEPITLNLTRQ